MAKYRKKPVVIDAFKWTGDREQEEDPIWIVDAIEKGDVYFDNGNMIIKTLEGDHRADIGDYIIRGVEGELYPCKPHIFERTYEKVE